jgi:hypothetical protein
MKLVKKLVLLFLACFLLFLMTNPIFAAPSIDIPLYGIKMWHVKADKKIPLQYKSMMIYEIEEILANVHQLTGFTANQLPEEYYLIQFPAPLLIPPPSPIIHPIKEMIVTIPRLKWEPHRLYLKNSQNQWLEYQTTRSLSLLIEQLKAWN